MPILFFVNCERTVLFSVKRDLDPPPPLPPSSYNLCDLCQTQKLGSFNVEMLKSICSHFEISFKLRDKKHQLIEKLAAMIAEFSCEKS